MHPYVSFTIFNLIILFYCSSLQSFMLSGDREITLNMNITNVFQEKITKRRSVLVLPTTCSDNETFLVKRLQEENIPYFEVKCDPITKYHDCYQNIPLVKFFLKYYDNPLADVYMVTDEHIKHYHHSDFIKAYKNAIKYNIFEEQDYGNIFGNWNTDYFTKGSFWDKQKYWKFSFYNGLKYFLNGTGIDWEGRNFFPCCVSFFVTPELIRRHPKEFYETLMDRATSWSRTNTQDFDQGPGAICGRWFEYTWHLIFTGSKHIPRHKHTIIDTR